LALKNLIGAHMQMPAQLFYNSKTFVYSFNKSNNLYPLLTRIESLLKNLFLSIYCLISRPVYLISHDKIVIRLFVYLSPKVVNLINNGPRSSLSIYSKNKDRNDLTNLFKLNNRLGTSTAKSKSAILVNNFNSILKKFSSVFEKIFKKQVIFQIIKLQHPFHNSNILAQVLGSNASKYKFKRLIKILVPRAVIINPSETQTNYFEIREEERKARRFKTNMTNSYLNSPFFNYNHDNFNNLLLQLLSSDSANQMPLLNNNQFNNNKKSIFNSYLSGINVRLGGRLITEGLRPRFTVQTKQEGTIARGQVQVIERSRYTGKNKRGSYSFTIRMSHVFNN
jgi:Mitochondrial ribosomal protein (VAR1)